jgi:CHASE1-domain containing sensor protein
MDTYIAMLRATTGLFAASDYVSHDEFQRFIDRLELQSAYPGIQGIGYSERAADNAPLAARLAREYARNIPVRSPADAPEHHAIIFVQPFDDVNRAAIGYDMFAEKAPREAMELARDGARPVASALVQLHDGVAGERRPGFLIYVPFYVTPDAPESVEARRRDLVGFIYASFSADDLFGTIVAESNSLAEFALYDSPITDPDALLFASPRFSPPTDSSPLRATTTITVAERMWTASLLPARPSPPAEHPESSPSSPPPAPS